ncbi:hypothetical protein PILCRDRAFT_14161 [Piloderma croceum F 1598]|uniref:TPR-like protein n=1 Tax=Piloderma croceum (strain F 1598) TaxID=765440 RepID=A0A0C3ALF6_PILCF|nr:hypothetical protein PILCRDRAFT_14161 [Piloderma croceum F 1598]
MQSNYKEAAGVLKKARDQFIGIGNQLGAAQCSQCLGDILCMQHNYREAASVLKKARDHLGNILHMQSNYKEAANVLKKAQDQFIGIGNQFGAAQCSRSLGNILGMQPKHEAANVLKKA